MKNWVAKIIASFLILYRFHLFWSLERCRLMETYSLCVYQDVVDSVPSWVLDATGLGVQLGFPYLVAEYVYVVPWSEFPMVPSYPHCPHAGG